MQLVLLSGGSGVRLWPLSNESRSKQFLKILKNENGQYESMLQRVYRQIRDVLPDADLLITTGNNQRDAILSQIGDSVTLLQEPQRRDTFPALMFVAAYLAYERKLPRDEAVVVLPVDPYTQREYFQVIEKMARIAEEGISNLVLMGITPTYPSEKYGYILLEPGDTREEYRRVKSFREKPTEPEAQRLIERGAVWNGGVFACRLSYLIDILQKYIPGSSFREIYERYGELERTSFDYMVVEKEPSISAVLYNGEWKDLGTWNTVTDEMAEPVIGQGILGEGARNTYIVNELNLPLVALGTQNMIIAASPDGILISDLEKSASMKPYVQDLSERPMYEERRWGDYRVLDYVRYENGLCSLTKHLTVNQGCALSYQSHAHRDEIWTIVDGTADVVLDGHVRNVRPGDVVYITTGQKHTLRAIKLLHLIEVQRGKELLEEDIVHYDWSWKD